MHKKTLIAVITIILIFFAAGAYKNYQDIRNLNSIKSANITSFTGDWDWDKNSASQNFYIRIKQSDNQISGSYCAIADNGNRLDCDENNANTFTGTVQGTIATLQFTDYYSNTSGTAILTLASPDQLTWQITKQPSGDFYLPLIAVMTRGD